MLDPETGFVRGTRIHTKDGLKPIESICANDWVLTHPEIVQAAPVAEAAPALDFSKPQELLRIENYYNDTLTQPEPPKAAPLMPELAQQMHEAAEKLRRKFKDQLQQELTYDQAGVRWLDAYIDRARRRPSSDQWQGAIHLIGAFLGECIVRNVGGQWSSHEGMHCVVLNHSHSAFPHNKVAKQFDNGSEGGDSILGFYQTTETLNEALFSKALTPAQERLREFARHISNRIFVRNVSGSASRWVQVTEVTDRWVKLLPPPGQVYATSISIADVHCFYVCAPSGQLLHTEWINKSDWDSLPPDILMQLRRKLAADTSLRLDQLQYGKRFLEITYRASDKPADDRRSYYATSIKNISQKRIEITRFGGFRAEVALPPRNVVHS
ncbi:MAG: hypothetical protein C4K60_19785 [Ideonella sp. MAG2]|nr:MAG: hypothetical protein C4K60_19785 [Ideonella sp. MAG2]